jgi:hypothetical protein
MNIMESDIENLKGLVKKYCELIHSQNEKDFKELWCKNKECMLISVGKVFKGIDSIYKDFLIDLIQNSYSIIDLIPDDIDVNINSDDLAIIIFKYHTDCILRKNGEKFGIKGVETQIFIKEENLWKLKHIHYSKV